MSDENTRRRRLSETFDQAADLYQRARPEYPPALIERLLSVTRVPTGARLLEIGPATGKATAPMARLGFQMTCLEPGPALAAAARRHLSGLDVQVIETRFEDWAGPAEDFDLAFAATSWHWIDPGVRYQKAAQVLRPDGHLAFWSAGHVIPYDGDPFFTELQTVYDEIGEGLPPGAPIPRPQELADDRAEIGASGLFDVVDISQFDWEVVYDADRYIDLLNTFSGHIEMADWQRERLYGEIRRRLAARPEGTLRRHWGAVLHIARRRS